MKSLNFNYLSKLDHLRFLAAILVIFHHFRGVNISISNIENVTVSNVVKIWLVQGSSGVSLFLVLSAFLFTLIANAGMKKLIINILSIIEF
ncbi:acyltransferase family protein [Actinobacillus sp. GY-402]|nr:acyltransferase family protein [Actinobacillus sp. GY-402]